VLGEEATDSESEEEDSDEAPQEDDHIQEKRQCSVESAARAAVEVLSIMISLKLKNTKKDWITAIQTAPANAYDFDFSVTCTIHEVPLHNSVEYLSDTMIDKVIALCQEAAPQLMVMHLRQSQRDIDWEVESQKLAVRRRYAGASCRNDGAENILGGTDFFVRQYYTQRTAVTSGIVCCRINETIPALVKRFAAPAERQSVENRITVCAQHAVQRKGGEAQRVQDVRALKVAEQKAKLAHVQLKKEEKEKKVAVAMAKVLVTDAAFWPAEGAAHKLPERRVTTLINEMPEVVCRNELRYWKLRDYSWPEFAPECFKQYTTEKKKAMLIASDEGFGADETRDLVAQYEHEGLMKMRAALCAIVKHRLAEGDARR
jgi:hypothetical protein